MVSGRSCLRRRCNRPLCLGLAIKELNDNHGALSAISPSCLGTDRHASSEWVGQVSIRSSQERRIAGPHRASGRAHRVCLWASQAVRIARCRSGAGSVAGGSILIANLVGWSHGQTSPAALTISYQIAPYHSVPSGRSRDTLKSWVLARTAFVDPLAARHIFMGASSPKQGHRSRFFGGDLRSPVDWTVSAPPPRTARVLLITPSRRLGAEVAAMLPNALDRRVRRTA